ncbi:MAG: hypothetical protein KC621_02485 [Myxococcales bacterium]|nr:hypothetical protein [Myxococcales bacterium]
MGVSEELEDSPTSTTTLDHIQRPGATPPPQELPEAFDADEMPTTVMRPPHRGHASSDPAGPVRSGANATTILRGDPGRPPPERRLWADDSWQPTEPRPTDRVLWILVAAGLVGAFALGVLGYALFS